MANAGTRYLRGPRIDPRPLTGSETIPELIDGVFLAYNAGRLREASRLFTERMLADEGTVGLSLTGALTPAGLGMSTVIPLIEAGFVDWIVSTGANLYHDAHFALGFAMHTGRPNVDDVVLREEGVVRIYDIFFDYRVLCERTRSSDRSPRAPSSNGRCRRRSTTTCSAGICASASASSGCRGSRCSPLRTSSRCRSTRPRPAIPPSG